MVPDESSIIASPKALNAALCKVSKTLVARSVNPSTWTSAFSVRIEGSLTTSSINAFSMTSPPGRKVAKSALLAIGKSGHVGWFSDEIFEILARTHTGSFCFFTGKCTWSTSESPIPGTSARWINAHPAESREAIPFSQCLLSNEYLIPALRGIEVSTTWDDLIDSVESPAESDCVSYRSDSALETRAWSFSAAKPTTLAIKLA